MKRVFLICTMCLTFMTNVLAGGIAISDITSGKFAAKTVNGINPIAGTDTYARISDDGKKVLTFSFKTGKQLAVLFDVDNTMGEKIKDFDGYIMSPDGKRLLIQTKTEKIYRRSFKATYYIYTISSRKLERLSDGLESIGILSVGFFRRRFRRRGGKSSVIYVVFFQNLFAVLENYLVTP